MSAYHIPVLLKESVSALAVRESGIYIDATFGGGGHSKAILERLGSKGRLMVFDKDYEALANLPDDDRVIAVNNNFRFIHNYVRYYGFDKVDGIIADLGVSSHQFDTSERGFSFRFNAPLDMRMNLEARKSAKDILNSYTLEELEQVFRVYGEVGKSRKVADLICRTREVTPIETTEDLGRALESVLPKFSEHKFLAKIYQALRIETNDELRNLELLMKGIIRSLKSGGIVSIISYHSLEDRIIKNFLKSGNVTGRIEKDLKGHGSSPFEPVNKKPIIPSEEEIAVNTRARSAKLRVAKRR